ncbi:division/cell wall cluster transcriptional repressor MraZ [Aerococcus vaginalis]
MLIGEYKHNIDTKGRLIIPAKFREDLGDRLIITRGLDGCIFGYAPDVWQQLQEKLKQLSLAKKNARAFVRFFYSAASEVSFDKQGRINIPDPLINFAKITKECRIIGVSDRIEIWDENAWMTATETMADNFESIAEDLFDTDQLG